MKVVVIGLGSMGRRRIRILKEKAEVESIIGIESDVSRAELVKRDFGIIVYNTLKEVSEMIDCAFVCTSPLSHALIIQECLNNGWNVFTEINLVNNLYKENIKLAKKRRKVLFLSSTFLYRDEIIYIGNVRKKSNNLCIYSYHVGQYLPDWHPWDKLENFFISDKRTSGCRELFAIELPWIQHVFGKIKSVNVVSKKITRLNLDYNDVYLVQVMHENGDAGNLIVDVVSRTPVRKLEMISEDFYLKWDGIPDSLEVKNLKDGKMESIELGRYEHREGYAANINEQAYVNEIDEFFRVINDGKRAVYGFEEDFDTLKIIDSIEGE